MEGRGAEVLERVRGLAPELGVGGGDLFGVALEGDFAVFDQNGAVAVFADTIHGVGDENDSLLAFDSLEIIITFLLEGSVTDSEDLIEKQDVTFGANGNGKGEADLHAAGEVFEFLIHERLELGKFDDFVVHFVHFFVGEAEHGTVEVDVFATREFRVETDAEFNEGDEGAIDLDGTFVGEIDFSHGFEQSGFAGAVAADDANKFAAADGERNAVEDFLLRIAFDALEAVENSLLQPPSALSGEAKAFVEVLNGNGDVAGNEVFFKHGSDALVAGFGSHQISSANFLERLRKNQAPKASTKRVIMIGTNFQIGCSAPR